MDKKKQATKTRMNKIWNKVAPTFGEIGPKYWDEFGNRLVELAAIDKGAKVLDIGMGRGASLFPAIKKVGEQGQVVGIDKAEVMVKKTYEDIKQRNIHNAEVFVMDTDELTFDDGSYDNIIGGFVLSYILFNEEKFSEILRVLKENGQIGLSSWGIVEDQNWLVELINKYLKKNSIENNKKVKDTNSNKKRDVQNFDTVEGVKRILKDTGFKDIKVYEEYNDVLYKDKEEWWLEMWSNASRNIFEKIEKLGVEKLEAFKNEAFEALESLRCDEGICFRMPVIYGFGRKQTK